MTLKDRILEIIGFAKQVVVVSAVMLGFMIILEKVIK